MPSRKLSGHCQRCNHKNHLRASYCNNCGVKLKSDSDGNYDSPQKLYADVAHPINSECREIIQKAVITEFEAELARAGEPGYRSRYDDDFDFEASDAEIVAKSVDAEQAKKSKKPEATSDESDSSTKSGSVPRPKFMDRDDREQTSTESNEDDGFGAGIF